MHSGSAAEEEGLTLMARFHRETPAEYFRSLVESALEHQHVKADDLTSYYLVNLLCGYIRLGGDAGEAFDDEPLALRLAKALDSGGEEQRARLRRLGDVSLFISGFFSDSLRRRVVDVDYYVSMGEYAYASLSKFERDTFAATFGELAEHFPRFVDVLCEVSEASGLTSNNDLMRLYERWLRTGSPRSGRRLAERGIVPNTSIGKRFIQ